MKENRGQFEKWFNELRPTPDMEAHKFKLSLFLAWMESRATVEIELPDMNSKRYVEHGTDFDFLQYKMDLEDAIRATGLRVKER